MKKGEGESIIRNVVIAFILLAVLLATITILGGKGEELMPNDLSGLYSPCNDLKQVSFADFMSSMKRVYEVCKNDESKCGYVGCETMTLKLIPENEGTYHQIDSRVLDKYGLTNFVVGGTSIVCDAESLFGGYEIGAFYTEDRYKREKDDSSHIMSIFADDKQICQILRQYRAPFFAIPDNSKITIKAKDMGYNTIDLKITIDGGTFTTQTDAPSPPECKTDEECNDKATPPMPFWGICSGAKKCEYIGFCQKYPTNPKCIPQPEVLKTCTLNKGCMESLSDCNGFTSKIRMVDDSTNPGKITVGVLVERGGKSAAVDIIEGEEKCISPSDIWGAVEVPCRSTDTKMSAWVKDINRVGTTDNYEVTVVQGCY